MSHQANLVLQSLEYLKRAQLSAIQARQAASVLRSSISSNKPRVNFHSIEDLATSECSSSENCSSSSSESMVDSGFCSYSNQSQKQTADESDSEDIEVSDSNKENSSTRKNDAASNKKLRTSFTELQKRALDVYFQRNPYPDPRETEELSQQLALPENVIKVWFQNKRSRDKQRKFSHKSKALLLNSDSSASFNNHSYSSSPLVANLQMLTSRFNPYAAVAAAAAAQSSQSLGKLFF